VVFSGSLSAPLFRFLFEVDTERQFVVGKEAPALSISRHPINLLMPSMSAWMNKVWNVVRGDPYPVLLSAIALALGLGPGWRFFWTLQFAEYDPTIAVLTATLIALIWTANYTFHAVLDARNREAREDARRRSAKASILAGVVAELEAQYVWLGAVGEQLYHVRIRRLDRPMMAEAQGNAHLFEADEIGVITTLSTHLYTIDSALTKLTDFVSRHVGDDYMNLDVKTIEALAPTDVQHLRRDITACRDNLKAAARLLSPEIYAKSDWARLDQPPAT
jgi:hypothetical protein